MKGMIKNWFKEIFRKFRRKVDEGTYPDYNLVMCLNPDCLLNQAYMGRRGCNLKRVEIDKDGRCIYYKEAEKAKVKKETGYVVVN